MNRQRRAATVALVSLLLVAVAGLAACEPVAAPRQTAVAQAKAQVGTPYRSGGAAPGGFDCSGLTSWAWKQAGVTLPRTAAAQYNGTARITKAQLQPGDLVFYSSGSTISHVSMYIGDGKIVQARKTGYPVEIQSVDWWSSNRVGYGRIPGV